MSRIKREQHEKAYRVYVTDALKAIIGAQDRYCNWIEPSKPEETRTPQEIIDSITNKIAFL